MQVDVDVYIYVYECVCVCTRARAGLTSDVIPQALLTMFLNFISLFCFVF